VLRFTFVEELYFEKNELTLKNDQNEPQVPQGKKRLLPFLKQDIPDGHAVDETDDYLPDQTCPDDLVRKPFGKGKEDEERDVLRD